MAHTNATSSDVQNLLDTDLTTSEIDPFLTAAQRFVTDQLEGVGIPDATLTQIEAWVAAGLVTSKEPLLTSARIDDIEERYLRDKNPYLAAAVSLDSTGRVEEAFFGVKRVQFYVGTGYDDDLDLPGR